MRAYEIQGAFGLDNLTAVERADLVPAAGQVRVALSAASLNFRDLLMVRGHYNPRLALPLIPLSDGVGRVDAVGAGVSEDLVGTRVAGCFVPLWQDGTPQESELRHTLGGPLDGMLAEQVVLPAQGVVRAPEHLTDTEAATLPCAALTAWSALAGSIQPGDVVLVMGTGGVSTFALDFARMHGARVIATTSSAAKAESLRARGAEAVVNYRETPDWGRAVRGLTDGRGVDLVVEVGGAGTLDQSIRAVRAGGTIAMIGVLAGGAAAVNMTRVLMNNLRIQGIMVGHRAGFEAMNQAITAHAYRPMVDRVFAFDEARAAFDYLASGQHMGKVAVAIG
ncbi:MAG: NADPH:quinone reductase-like Zn-dependent oxidoreductase [Myxococcota bacterium]|jgi:NADPH:quinone reductase-like Zn-dependent oxidoreductase